MAVAGRVAQRPRPTSIDGWLKRMLREADPEGPALRKARDRAAKIEGLLLNDEETGVLKVHVGGSVGKGTANAPVKDLDLYLELDPAVWGDASNPPDAKQLLEAFVERLRHARRWQYERHHLRVERQTHSVGIIYQADGSANIDVVPMLVAPRLPGIFAIPRRTDGGYVQTAVLRQKELIERLDGPGRDLRDGIRLLKLWSQPRAPRLPSYALEILARSVVQRRCEHSAPGVFWAVLDHLGEDELRSRVHVAGFVSLNEQRFPGVRHRGVIMDPAVVGNNVTYRLTGDDADDIAEQARYTLA